MVECTERDAQYARPRHAKIITLPANMRRGAT
jgi:hypothetical protein